MPNKSFAQRMKEHQIIWAGKNGLDQLLEKRNDTQPSWVLKKEHKKRNLQDATWWKHIEGREHLWSRALNSSQCFGVNLFGPLAINRSLAKQALTDTLFQRQELEGGDEVTVLFEHTPEDAPEWLGETKQATQVDVFFTVKRMEKPIGFLLVEVKYTEQGFGSCRGAVKSIPTKPGNPDSKRCENLQAVLENPKKMCWMAEAENGRHYWDFMLAPSTPFNFSSETACPFRQSLYQLMRNQVLAIALVQKTKADWAEFGVCIHPRNEEVRQLKESVAGHNNPLQSFNELLPNQKKLIEINPLDIIELVRSNDPSFSEWADWMISRYDLH